MRVTVVFSITSHLIMYHVIKRTIYDILICNLTIILFLSTSCLYTLFIMIHNQIWMSNNKKMIFKVNNNWRIEYFLITFNGIQIISNDAEKHDTTIFSPRTFMNKYISFSYLFNNILLKKDTVVAFFLDQIPKVMQLH